jgi:hypothetical protein
MAIFLHRDRKSIGGKCLNDVSLDHPFRIGLFGTCGRLGHHVPALTSNPAIIRIFLLRQIIHTRNKGKMQCQALWAAGSFAMPY